MNKEVKSIVSDKSVPVTAHVVGDGHYEAAFTQLRIPEFVSFSSGICPAGRFLHQPDAPDYFKGIINMEIPPSPSLLNRRFCEYLLTCTTAAAQPKGSMTQANGFDFVRFLRAVVGDETIDDALEVISLLDDGKRTAPLRVAHNLAFVLRCLDIGLRGLYTLDDPEFVQSLLSRLTRFTGGDLPADVTLNNLPEYGTGAAFYATDHAHLSALSAVDRVKEFVIRKDRAALPKDDVLTALTMFGFREPLDFCRILSLMNEEQLARDLRLTEFMKVMTAIIAERGGGNTDVAPAVTAALLHKVLKSMIVDR